jgi:hypothetical protein
MRLLRQIVDNGLGVGRWDRRTIRLDHLGDFSLPALTVQEQHILARIVERVTGAAIAFDDVSTRARLERDVFLSLGVDQKKKAVSGDWQECAAS